VTRDQEQDLDGTELECCQDSLQITRVGYS